MKNNKTYWLMGGIIFTIVLTLLSLYSIISIMNCATIGNYENLCANSVSILNIYLFNIMNIIEYPAMEMARIFSNIIILNDISILIYKIIWNFLLGASIGFIYGKVKNRKQ